MVIPIKDKQYLVDIIELIKKIKKLPCSVEEYVEYISRNLDSSDTLLLVNFEKDKADSFLFAEIVYNPHPDVFIDLAYISPKQKELGKDFLELLELWGRLKKAKRIIFLADSRVKAYEKKYNFKVISTLMGRDITYEKTETYEEKQDNFHVKVEENNQTSVQDIALKEGGKNEPFKREKTNI